MKKDFYKFMNEWCKTISMELFEKELPPKARTQIKKLYNCNEINSPIGFACFFVCVQQINRFQSDKSAKKYGKSLKEYKNYCDNIAKGVQDALPYINGKNISLTFPVYPPITIKSMNRLMTLDKIPNKEINAYIEIIKEYIYPFDRLKNSKSFDTIWSAPNQIEQQKAQFIYILRG